MTDELCQNYASALYDMLQPSLRESAMDALGAVVRDLREQPELCVALSSPRLTREEKRGILDKLYGKRFANLTHFIPFLYVVIDHHRIKKLPGINTAYRSLVHADLGVKEGYLYTAASLSEKQIKDIEAALEKSLGSKVSLTPIVDHKLLGGVKVSIDGKVYDGTLSSRLQGMKRALKGGTQS